MKKSILLNSALILSSAAIITSCNKTPEASLTADKTSAIVGESVLFTDGVAERKNVTIIYDFGDGSTSVGQQNASHVYSRPGKYTVTMNVMGNKNAEKGKGKYASATTTVDVKGVATKITASKATATVGETVTFKNESTDGDKGYKASYQFWIVDGFGSTVYSSNAVGKKDNSYKFTYADTYTVYLYATQGPDHESLTSTTVTVSNLNGVESAWKRMVGNYGSMSASGSGSGCSSSSSYSGPTFGKTWIVDNGSYFSVYSFVTASTSTGSTNETAGEEVARIYPLEDGYVSLTLEGNANGTGSSNVEGRGKATIDASGNITIATSTKSVYSTCTYTTSGTFKINK